MQRRQRDLRLEPCQRRTQAEMRPEPERHMRVRCPRQTQRVRLLEHVRITIGRADEGPHPVTRPDPLPAKLHIAQSNPHHRQKWGMAMGPLAVMDLAGMDVGWRIRKEHEIPAERRNLYKVTDALVEAGRHGQKTKAGMYLYPDGRTRTVDPKVTDMFRAEAAKQGVAHRNGITAEEIVERGLLRLINTGADILDEGIAARSSDIDTIYLNGYGFQAWRGGPMWQADHMGLAEVAKKIKAYHAKYGARWKIAPLIATLADSGGTFAGRDKAKA
jgi:3-hydroxyacyl-CoA dehydrogenase